MEGEIPTGEAGQTETAAEGESQKSGETERTFSQADIDRIVADRLAKERQKAEALIAKAKAEAERKAAEEQGNWRALAEQYKQDATAAAERLRLADLAILRRDVAANMNVPSVLADRLRGDTLEEITDDAKKLLASLPKATAPTGNAGSGSKQTGASDRTMNTYIRAMAGRTQQ